MRTIADKPISPQEGILHHKEGMDLMPVQCAINLLSI